MTDPVFELTDFSAPVYLTYQNRKFWEISLNEYSFGTYVRCGGLTRAHKEDAKSVQTASKSHSNLAEAISYIEKHVKSKFSKGYIMPKKPTPETPKSQSMTLEPAKPTSYSINILPSPEPESKPKNEHKRKDDESFPEREDLKQVKVSSQKKDEAILADMMTEIATLPEKEPEKEKIEVEKESLASPNFSAVTVSVESSQNEGLKTPQSGIMKSPGASPKKMKYRFYTNSNDDEGEEEAEPVNLGALEITNHRRSNTNRSTPVKSYEQSYNNNSSNNKIPAKNDFYQNKSPAKGNPSSYQNPKVYERSPEKTFEKSPERNYAGGNHPLGKPLDKPYRYLLEASIWQNEDPIGWYMSEKLAGVRCFWDGQRMWSGSGESQHIAPAFFTKDFPKSPLDGQLWTGRSAFTLQKCAAIVRRREPVDSEWEQVRFMVFDCPEVNLPFKDRYEKLKEVIGKIKSPYLEVLEHKVCKGVDELYSELITIKEGGGDGLMIRDPKSFYDKKKSKTLLDIKTLDE